MKKRIGYLDAIRVFACLLIVLMHAPKPGLGTSGTILSSISYVCAPGIGLFFMISGALLLPVSQPMRHFYKKRFSQLVPPLLIWTVVYILLGLREGGGTAFSNLLKTILSIPFSAQGSGTLWFFYTLIGLYLLVPVISPFLENAKKKEIEFILLLWVITLCYPFLKEALSLDTSTYGILYYFSGFAGYFVLGYYLNRNAEAGNLGIWAGVLLIGLPLLVAVIFRAFDFEVNFYQVFWYQSLLVVSMCAGWFLLFKWLFERWHFKRQELRFLALLSNLSLGVYLIHFALEREVLWEWPLLYSGGGVLQIVLTTILAVVVSFFFSWLISLLPFGDIIIGYRRRDS